MIAFLCTSRLQILVPSRGFSLKISKIHLGSIQNGLLYSVRTLLTSLKPEEDEKKYSHLASYLVNTCEFSPESAESVSKKIGLETLDRPHAVVNLLRDYGFTNADISRLIRKHTRVLLADPSKTLLPKLYFLRSIGVSSSDLGRMVSWDPGLLCRSLEQHLIPCYNILKSVLVSDENVVKALKRSSGIVMNGLSKNLSINISFLREIGLPQSTISCLMIYKPFIVCMNSDRLRQIVHKTIEIGFDPLKSTKFGEALAVMSQMTANTWEQKMEVYRSWGLSDDEIWLAIKKYPLFVMFSRKKIMNNMDFLVNKMGWLPAEVARVPAAIAYSLEKRIVPRCSVLRVLLLKSLIKREIPLASVLTSSEKYFLKSFVIKYEEKVPELLRIFRGEMNIVELGFGFEEKSSLSPVI